MPKFFVTCAIDYANGDPHHGHAFEKIGADAIARYRRLSGADVHFLVGMDEHGQKVAQEAALRGVAPQQLVDDIAARFQKMWTAMEISYDQFIRTTDSHHRAGVRNLVQRIFEKSPDDFYEKAYAGWYCVGCEAFKQDSEIVDGKCVLHPTREMEWVEETNWFFRLSAYSDELKKLLSDESFLRPRSRRNEMLALLEQGLEDISASRSRLKWGVPFPRDTSNGEAQATYVWFDALPNYLTATGFPEAGYEKLWPADLHIIGKDIVRFHAIIWPAMLMAAGLPLPKAIWAHGFVLLAGERFSKSAGVQLDLGEATRRYGVDAFRYFLLREVPFDGDGNFSWERFEERYNADLANAFGNLASRTIAMLDRYFDGVVPKSPANEIDAADLADLKSYHSAMDGTDGYLLSEALKAVWRTVSRGNEFVDHQAPWKLAKEPAQRGELERTLATLIRQLARQAICLFPFMPKKAQELWDALGAPDKLADRHAFDLEKLDVSGWKVKKSAPLFPKTEAVTASAAPSL
jgi:methionyl-tRNA synthetase